jgi:hypothetical protein
MFVGAGSAPAFGATSAPAAGGGIFGGSTFGSSAPNAPVSGAAEDRILVKQRLRAFLISPN